MVGHDIYVLLIAYVLCCCEWGYRKPTPTQNVQKIYTNKSLLQNVWPKISESQVSHSKDISHTPNPKILRYFLRKDESLLWTRERVSRLGQVKKRKLTHKSSSKRCCMTYYFLLGAAKRKSTKRVMRRHFCAPSFSSIIDPDVCWGPFKEHLLSGIRGPPQDLWVLSQ